MLQLSMFQASHHFFLPTSLVESEQLTVIITEKTKHETPNILLVFNTFPPHSQALLHINLGSVGRG